MKNLFYYFVFVLLVGFLSCSDDDPYIPQSLEVSISNLTGETSIAQEDTLYLKADVKGAEGSAFSWFVDGKEVSKAPLYKFATKELGDYKIRLLCSDSEREASAEIDINVYGKYRHGTFILNEGNPFSGNGSLVFISPKGIVTDSAYYKANGTTLGNATQDLFIANGKIYIIAQNKKKNLNGQQSDGQLIVANAETLKKEAAYNDEISVLSNATHIAVLDEYVYIRDTKGVYAFNTETREIKLVKNTDRSLKNRMAVADGKVFVPNSSAVIVIEKGGEDIVKKIGFGASISGVVRSEDGNILVSTTGTPQKITKINAKDYTIIKENEITQGGVGYGSGATPGITVKGDTVYHSNASTKIYRHIFTTGESQLMVDAKTMVDDASIVYNNIAVHPITGEVYLNTLKGFGANYLVNHISVFNFAQPQPRLSADYQDYTQFPAGIFFTYDYK